MSEEKYLTKKAKKGDSEAFGKLYDIHLSPIYRFIFIRVREKTDAEDLAQQVFLKAWRNIDKFEHRKGAKFSSWLYKIARNTIIDYYRTNKEHTDIDSLPEHLIISKKREDMEDRVDDKKRMKDIIEVIGRLSEKDQELIIMKFVEDLPNNEIADILNKNEGTIRVACHRALKRLKKIMKKYHEKR